MRYGLIIAAGNQSRFESDLPKALVDINGRTLLNINIERLQTICDKVYTVVSWSNEAFFHSYTNDLIVIESGRGCGDAVLKALQQLHLTPLDTVLIQWGDSIQDPAIYSLIGYDNARNPAGVLIPCRVEDEPYVQVQPITERTVHVLFTKYGEKTTRGYHDLSIFFCNATLLAQKLKEFSDKIKQPDGSYKHPHNNEMQFLDVFNETDIPVEVLPFSAQSYSFNTVNELEELRNGYKQRERI